MHISGITRGYQTISLVFDSNVGQIIINIDLKKFNCCHSRCLDTACEAVY